MKRSDDDHVLVITVYVDDLVCTSDSDGMFTWFEDELAKQFEYTNQGEISYCLGVEFLKSLDDKILTMCQRKYSQDLLVRFGMTGCK